MGAGSSDCLLVVVVDDGKVDVSSDAVCEGGSIATRLINPGRSCTTNKLPDISIDF